MRTMRLDALRQDLGYGVRSALAAPIFSLTVVAILALGIGANGALFAIVRGVLMSPLDYPESERLVQLVGSFRGESTPVHSYPNILDVAKTSKTLERISPVQHWGTTVWSETPLHMTGLSVGSAYFSALRVEPARGRFFTPEDDAPSHPNVVVVSHAFWRDQLGRRDAVLLERVKLGDDVYTIVGVAPADFVDPFVPDARFWRATPAHWQSAERSGNWLRVLARLRPGVELTDARLEADLMIERLKASYPEAVDASRTMEIVYLKERLVSESRRGLVVLFAAVGAILLLACANVANLMLSRARNREREIAVRRALGASPDRILAQLLTENVLLGSAAVVAALVLANWALGWMLDLGGAEIPRRDAVALDAGVFVFIIVLGFASAILFGLAPGLRGRKIALSGALKAGARSSADPQGNRLRRSLVVAEIVLAFVLLVAAGLSLKSLDNLYDQDTGMTHEQTLSFELSAASTRHPEGEALAQFRSELRDSLKALPAVAEVGLTNALPLKGMSQTWSVSRDDRAAPSPAERPIVEARAISHGYLRAAGIRLIRGRDFDGSDRPNSPPVALVNQAFVDHVFPGESAMNESVTLHETSWRLIGVIADVREESVDTEPRPTIYTLASQGSTPDWMLRFVAVVIRSREGATVSPSDAKEGVWRVDAAVPVVEIESFEDIIARSVATPRLRAWVLGLLSALGLLLAAMGTSAVMAHSVTDRLSEIAIRMAVGADARRVVRLLVGEGMGLLMWGLGIGLACSLLFVRSLRALLFAVEPYDFWTFGGVFVFLTAIGFMSCLAPALRAARVSPLDAMRSD